MYNIKNMLLLETVKQISLHDSVYVSQVLWRSGGKNASVPNNHAAMIYMWEGIKNLSSSASAGWKAAGNWRTSSLHRAIMTNIYMNTHKHQQMRTICITAQIIHIHSWVKWNVEKCSEVSKSAVKYSEV